MAWMIPSENRMGGDWDAHLVDDETALCTGIPVHRCRSAPKGQPRCPECVVASTPKDGGPLDALDVTALRALHSPFHMGRILADPVGEVRRIIESRREGTRVGGFQVTADYLLVGRRWPAGPRRIGWAFVRVHAQKCEDRGLLADLLTELDRVHAIENAGATGGVRDAAISRALKCARWITALTDHSWAIEPAPEPAAPPEPVQLTIDDYFATL